MTTNQLPVSRLINVGVVLTPAGAIAQSLSQLLLLSTLSVIDPVERYRVYASLTAVGIDFGSTTDEYKAAQSWFSQTPRPPSIMIGRWCKATAYGGIRGRLIVPGSSSSLIASWNAITTGSFAYQVDGGSLVNVTGLNFSAAADLNGVAAIINTAITAVATCVYNASYQRFEINSKTLGASSSISVLSAAGSGTDIPARLQCTSADLLTGAYLYTGQAAETPGAVYTLFDGNYGQKWYALVATTATDANAIVFGTAVEGSTNKHIYGHTSSDATMLLTTDVSSVGYQAFALSLTRTLLQYSSTTPYAVCSALSKLLSVDYGGQNTTITLMYQGEPITIAENLNVNQANALESKNVNVFVAYDNGTAIFEQGTMSARGVFADQITDIDAFAVTVQTRLFNVLYTNGRKIPQTDQGTHILVTTIEDVGTQFVGNGTLAAGQWNSGGFGTLQQGDNLPKGFYVFAPPVATQDPAIRAQRISVPIQCACKLAGAIHDVNLSIVVNQ